MALKTFGQAVIDLMVADGVSFGDPAVEDATRVGIERLATAKQADTTPTPTATGSPGQMRADGGYLYLCVEPDTWVRFAVETTWT